MQTVAQYWSPRRFASDESSASLRPLRTHPSFQELANVQRVKQVSRSDSDRRWSSWRHSSSPSSSQAAQSGGTVLICGPVSRLNRTPPLPHAATAAPRPTQTRTNRRWSSDSFAIRPLSAPTSCIKHRSRVQLNPGRHRQTSSTSFSISEPLATRWHISFAIAPRHISDNDLHPSQPT